MSGIDIDEEVPLLYNDMKTRHSDKFAIFKIEDKKIIVVDHRSGPKSTSTRGEDEESFQELAALLEDEPRYVIYDFEFESSIDRRKISQLGLIYWYVGSNE